MVHTPPDESQRLGDIRECRQYGWHQCDNHGAGGQQLRRRREPHQLQRAGVHAGGTGAIGGRAAGRLPAAYQDLLVHPAPHLHVHHQAQPSAARAARQAAAGGRGQDRCYSAAVGARDDPDYQQFGQQALRVERDRGRGLEAQCRNLLALPAADKDTAGRAPDEDGRRRGHQHRDDASGAAGSLQSVREHPERAGRHAGDEGFRSGSVRPLTIPSANLVFSVSRRFPCANMYAIQNPIVAKT